MGVPVGDDRGDRGGDGGRVGVAFAAVLNAFVADLIMPIIGAIFGKSDFSNLTFTVAPGTAAALAALTLCVTAIEATAAPQAAAKAMRGEATASSTATSTAWAGPRSALSALTK